MSSKHYLEFCHEMGYVSNDANRVTSNINELEYEECLGAIKKALFISGDDDYVENYLGDEERATNYVKDILEHRSQDYDPDNCDDDCNCKKDEYTYDNELREYHCGVVNDSDWGVRKAAYSYEAALDSETQLTTKKDCILDYVENEFGSNGARYTDIIKFAYYLGEPNAPKYTSANRGYYSAAFNDGRSQNGHLIRGGKDCLVKGINTDGKERYFPLSFVESVTDYWNYITEPKFSNALAYEKYHANPKFTYNSVQSIVDVLNEQQLLPESEIHRRAFGYDRSTSYGSNKKYADMLRRGLTKGLYKRVELGKGASSKYPQSEYFYFTSPNYSCQVFG